MNFNLYLICLLIFQDVENSASHGLPKDFNIEHVTTIVDQKLPQSGVSNKTALSNIIHENIGNVKEEEHSSTNVSDEEKYDIHHNTLTNKHLSQIVSHFQNLANVVAPISEQISKVAHMIFNDNPPHPNEGITLPHPLYIWNKIKERAQEFIQHSGLFSYLYNGVQDYPFPYRMSKNTHK